VGLLDWNRKLITGASPDRPRPEHEREHEEPWPENAFDVRARTEQNLIGDDFDPGEPRSGRL
jgi:hypothetical protein